MMKKKIINTVILDIEGTTTPITFVHDVMFTHFRHRLMSFITEKWGSQTMSDDANALFSLYQQDKSNGIDIQGQKGVISLADLPPVIDPTNDTRSSEEKINSIYNNCIAMLDIDRKATPFKQLQGNLFKEAFESDILRGQVYPDVIEIMDRYWIPTNTSVYIYSSGSIAAQKLLFGNCCTTDQSNNKKDSPPLNLLPKLKGHFDTTIGSKIESSSYSNILNLITINGSSSSSSNSSDNINQQQQHKPSTIATVADTTLFVTDSQKEALAACKANLNVAISCRPGNAPLDQSLSQQIQSINPNVQTITSFMDLLDYFTFQ